jgi:hypothetical protein
MDTIKKKFEKMGARVQIRAPQPSRFARRMNIRPDGVRLDIVADREGELFDLRVDRQQVDLQVLDIQPAQRHLLLMTRNRDTGSKEKFLCGHDERHWFVAAVPPGSAASVTGAMEALKPDAVKSALTRARVPNKHRNRRRNAAFVRQGEWFFLPARGIRVPEDRVLRNEPLQRGNGKPHVVDYLVRIGGETVYVAREHRNPLTAEQHRRLLERREKARNWNWQVMRRNPDVFVRGRVRHSDHKTIVLDGWHRVVLNRETDAPAMRSVAFLD